MKGEKNAKTNYENCLYCFDSCFCHWYGLAILFEMMFIDKKIVEDSDEEIIEEVRRHPIVLMAPLFKVFVGFIIVVLIFIIFKATLFFSIAFFAWFIFGGIYGIYHYYIWKKDAYIITDSRIIIREQKSFFSKEVSEANLGDITDVVYKVKGFWATLFNFGTIKVQTASSDPLKLVNVPKPYKTQKMILDLRDMYKEANSSEMSARELLDKLEKANQIEQEQPNKREIN